jgi:hypothetical protein
MAISRNNPLTKGASGMIGKTIVFRSWNGKTYMYNRPSKPTKESPLQKENRTKFSRAVSFSRKMMADPAKKAEYKEIAKQQGLPNAYTAAVTEYMRKPEILGIDTSTYSGEANQEIKVTTSKKGFTVQEVKVMIMDEDGTLIEEGTALKAFGDEWLFKTTTNIPRDQKVRIIAKATDRTNNRIEKVKEVFLS